MILQNSPSPTAHVHGHVAVFAPPQDLREWAFVLAMMALVVVVGLVAFTVGVGSNLYADGHPYLALAR